MSEELADFYYLFWALNTEQSNVQSVLASSFSNGRGRRLGGQ